MTGTQQFLLPRPLVWLEKANARFKPLLAETQIGQVQIPTKVFF